MLSHEDRLRCVEHLLRARSRNQLVPQLSRIFPALDLEDAYGVQDLWVLARAATGSRAIGYKVGLTTRGMQQALQACEPDYGRILDDAVFTAGERIPAARFLQPRIEVEVAFVMDADLHGAQISVDDVLRATRAIFPALEIVDRRTELPRTITDTIADNAAFGGLVLGSEQIDPAHTDLRWIAATMARNGVIEETGVSAAVLGNPAAAVAWLAVRLASAGCGLEKGQIVLSGAFMRSIEVAAGDDVLADYGPFGKLRVSFT